MATIEQGRRVVKAVNPLAHNKGVFINMVVADCKAIVPDLEILDYKQEQPTKLLIALAEWCICYTPFVSLEKPDALILDVSGCTHLWGSEELYLKNIYTRLSSFGYTIKVAMADTIGTALAVCRFDKNETIVKSGTESTALLSLPVAALRLDHSLVERLNKLGLKTIGSFITMPTTALRRRFGQSLLTRLAQAQGAELEIMDLVIPIIPYQEQLSCLEPIRTPEGIEVAIKTLLEQIYIRLQRESLGLRKCAIKCYRLDGVIEKIEIGTSRPSRNTLHLFKLFENKITEIEPDLGIELFTLEASVVEELQSSQDSLWTISGKGEAAIAELLDRLAGKTGGQSIHRYLPAEHYLPERSFKEATFLGEKAVTQWRTDLPRPLHILSTPELIDVSVRLPDYPPLLFKYKNVLHTVKKADGPERIEQEWWIEDGLYRDYYCVEDEKGCRYWLFRSGDYNSGYAKWFIHGFFA